MGVGRPRAVRSLVLTPLVCSLLQDVFVFNFHRERQRNVDLLFHSCARIHRLLPVGAQTGDPTRPRSRGETPAAPWPEVFPVKRGDARAPRTHAPDRCCSGLDTDVPAQRCLHLRFLCSSTSEGLHAEGVCHPASQPPDLPLVCGSRSPRPRGPGPAPSLPGASSLRPRLTSALTLGAPQTGLPRRSRGGCEVSEPRPCAHGRRDLWGALDAQAVSQTNEIAIALYQVGPTPQLSKLTG